MRYELPRKNIQKNDEIVESSIASFWNLKNEWQWNIYHLLKNINSISIKSYKNKENFEVIEKDLFTFLMLSLYYEIPYQMGTLYIIQNNTEIRNKFKTDKNNLISKLNEVLELSKEWNTAIEQERIKTGNSTYNFINLINGIRDFLPDMEQNYYFENFEYLDSVPYRQNPLFGKKINTKTMLRDFVIRYLDFLLVSMKIDFKSNYEKHKYIYDILILLFKNDRYKIFNIMNNLEITDIKKYVKYDQKEVIIKFYEISLNIHNLCAFNYKYTLNNENIEYYNKAYKNRKCIALPIVYPYIKLCTDTNITVKKFDSFFTQCMIDNEIY